MYILRKFDEKIYNKHGKILGIDEVGRGAGFGPLVVCGIILENFNFSKEIKDSKALNRKKREELCELILNNAEYCKIEFSSNKEVDKKGLSRCLGKSIDNIIAGQDKAGKILLDGNVNFSSTYLVECVVRGDSKSFTIACASIVAKVTRDNYIYKIADKYNNYDLNKNLGYPTPRHKELVKEYGLSDKHRETWNWQ